jgi:formate dehydrogenase accessory protein FdhE
MGTQELFDGERFGRAGAARGISRGTSRARLELLAEVARGLLAGGAGCAGLAFTCAIAARLDFSAAVRRISGGPYAAGAVVHDAASMPALRKSAARGVLRPEGDGGKRYLFCALCSHEWEFRRIVCVACGEEDEKKQAVYIAKEIGHVRVEACDTCHFYLKTVDLTKDGHAIPIVDELAAIPLDLWAAEHGYRKIHTNLIGV